MFNPTKYMKQYWKDHPEQYAKHKERCKNRNKTAKGLKYKKEWYKKNPDYRKEYMKMRRQQCRENGVCQSCMKVDVVKDKSSCKECLEQKRNHMREINKKNQINK